MGIGVYIASSKMKRFIFSASVLAVALVGVGCDGKQSIKVYRVSKEQAVPRMPDSSAMQGGMPAMEGGNPHGGVTGGVPAEITSEPPAKWELQPPSSMRIASYLVRGENGAVADVSLVALGGAAGGDLENVNRWLSQLGQPSITAEQLAQMARRVPSGFGEAVLVDLKGLPQGADPAKDGRILAAIVSGEGNTLFFKIRGNADLVGSQVNDFVKWIASVRPAGAASRLAPPPPANPAASVPEPAPEKPRLQWEVPPGWSPVQASSMRYASFAVAGQNGESVDIAISVFPGDTGGDLANVNRWRGQIGLEPMEAAALKSLMVSVSAKNGVFQTVELSGPKGRILAGWTLRDGQTWFFKASGPDRLVAGEKEKFVKFLQSVQF
jgi:hypothetical protein